MLDVGLKEATWGVCDRILALTPANAPWLNNASWALVTADQPGGRDAALAVRLARKAVEADPHNSSYQKTLGAALYRAGDWSGAVAELEQAAARNPETDGRSDLFFLAMAHQRAGNADAARRYCAQAMNSVTDRFAGDKGLLRLQAEAESLLRASH
jgi:tetratricopeptide (TPR) repeat protein